MVSRRSIQDVVNTSVRELVRAGVLSQPCVTGSTATDSGGDRVSFRYRNPPSISSTRHPLIVQTFT